MIPSYKIKKRYLLVEKIDNLESKIKEKFIYFFGLFSFSKAKIKKIFENNSFILLSVNRKDFYKLLFILYILKIKLIKTYKTLKEFKKDYKNNFLNSII